HPRHRGYVRGYRHGIWRDGPYVAAYGKGGGKATAEEIRAAKEIDWSTDHFRLREALPPAYTEWIGAAYLTTLAPRLEMAA
ncbi:DNA methylase, partial [Streptomyces sp. NPDC002346]